MSAHDRWREVLPPLVLGRAGSSATVAVHVPDGSAVRLRADLERAGSVDLEQVEDWTPAEIVDGARVGRARFSLSALPAGWHTLVATIEHDGRTDSATAPVLVAPDERAGDGAVDDPNLQIGREEYGGRGWGLSLDLHGIRTARSWGIGDWADLADLAAITARAGGDFLQLNPVTAVAGHTGSGLPVSPFPDPIHIRPEDVREVAYLPGAQRTLVEWGTEAVRPWNTDAGAIDLAAAWEAKRSALETIHAAGRSPARDEAYAAFRERGGELLLRYAQTCAEQAGGSEEFYTWLAWIGTEQAAAAQRAARIAGMSIGVLAPVDLTAADAADWTGIDTPLRWAHWLRAARRTAGGVLVRLGEGGEPARELYPALAETERTDVRSLLEAAAGSRLLVLDEEHERGDQEPAGIWGRAVVWNLPEADLPTTTLASVVVDTVPSAGFLAGEHVDLAERLGLLTDPAAERLAARTRRERRLAAMREEYLVPHEATERQVIEGLYRSLVRTPARLISVALADAVGERRPQLVAGAGDAYPGGRLPLADGSGQAVLIDELPATVRFTSLIGALAADLAEFPGEGAR